MIRFLLPSLVTAVLASTASAQATHPAAPTLGTYSQPLYVELEEPTSTPLSERVHLEVAGGLLAGGVMVGLGYAALERDCSDAADSGSCAFGRGLTSLFLWTGGQALAIPAGVTLGGSIGGGDGGYGYALLGSGAGTGLGALLWYGVAQSVDGDAVLPLGHLMLGTFALAGSLLGYELSTSPSAQRDIEPAYEQVPYVRVEPMIAAVPNLETLSFDAITVGVQGTM